MGWKSSATCSIEAEAKLPDNRRKRLRWAISREFPQLPGGYFSLRPDDDASADVYGHAIKAKDIVRSEMMGVPATGRHRVDALQKGARGNESERSSNQQSGV